MFLLETSATIAQNTEVLTAIKNFFDKDTVFTIINLIIAGFTAWCAYKANQNNETAQKANESAQTAYNSIKAIVENNFTVYTTVENIINDEKAIEKIANAVTSKKLNEYTKNGHPPIIFRDSSGKEISGKHSVILVDK